MRDAHPEHWDPELLERLYGLLYSVDLGSEALESGLAKLHGRYHDAVYSELIYLLSHLRYEPAEAEQHWSSIRQHRVKMSEQQGTPVDLRVALVSYFVEVNQSLRMPKIIEMRLFERTRASAYRDELTGLYNYRLFREYLRQELLRSDRCRVPLSVVMLDVDHFKSYNDVNGHEAGNQALATIARLLTRSLRKADVAARYGGEEFALILPSTSKIAAQSIAEKARVAIEQHAFSGEHAVPGECLTISLGLATFPADADRADDLVRHADRAMYVAKSSGKNQVRLYGENRRSFERAPIEVSGSFRRLSDPAESMRTIDLSENGLRFRSRSPVVVSESVEVHLDSGQGGLTVWGRVVHVSDCANDGYEVAVQLLDATDGDRQRLTTLIRELALPAVAEPV